MKYETPRYQEVNRLLRAENERLLLFIADKRRERRERIATELLGRMLDGFETSAAVVGALQGADALIAAIDKEGGTTNATAHDIGTTTS